jgi:hypothetical protein
MCTSVVRVYVYVYVLSVCVRERVCVCALEHEPESVLSVVSQSTVDRKETIQPFRISQSLIYIFVYGHSRRLISCY